MGIMKILRNNSWHREPRAKAEPEYLYRNFRGYPNRQNFKKLLAEGWEVESSTPVTVMASGWAIQTNQRQFLLRRRNPAYVGPAEQQAG